MSAHVLLNLVNKLGKSDKMRCLPSILSLFCNKFNKFNHKEAPTFRFYFNTIRASACDFQQLGIWTCVDLDEPLQPPFKLRNSKWCSVSSLTIIKYSSH